MFGDPDEAEVFITAHYDTCALLPCPNFMAPTNPFLFILFQLLIVILVGMISFGIGIGLTLIMDDPSVGYPAFLATLMLLVWQGMFGIKNKHTANDNTSGVLTITRILEALPPEHRHKVCAVYFDNDLTVWVMANMWLQLQRATQEKIQIMQIFSIYAEK